MKLKWSASILLYRTQVLNFHLTSKYYFVTQIQDAIRRCLLTHSFLRRNGNIKYYQGIVSLMFYLKCVRNL